MFYDEAFIARKFLISFQVIIITAYNVEENNEETMKKHCIQATVYIIW